MHLREALRVVMRGAVLILFASLTAFGQATCGLVIPIVVRPEKTKIVARKGDFSLRLRDAKVKGTVLDRKPGGRYVVVLMDESASMKGRWDISKFLALQLLQVFDPSDQIIYAHFKEKVLRSVSSTRDRQQLFAAVEKAELPAGRTAMRDAIATTLDRLPGLAEHDAIVVISDGGDNASKMQNLALIRELLSRGVRLFAVVVSDDPLQLATPEEAIGPLHLEELTEKTGGFSISPLQAGIRLLGDPKRPDDASSKKISTMLGVLANAIDRPNLVRFDLPKDVTGWKKSPEIELTDETGHKLKGLRLLYPRRPLTCDQPVAVPAKPN